LHKKLIFSFLPDFKLSAATTTTTGYKYLTESEGKIGCVTRVFKMVVLHFFKKGRRCLWDDAVCLLINRGGKYIILKLNDYS